MKWYEMIWHDMKWYEIIQLCELVQLNNWGQSCGRICKRGITSVSDYTQKDGSTVHVEQKPFIVYCIFENDINNVRHAFNMFDIRDRCSNGYCYPVLYSYIVDDSGSLLLGNCFSDVKRALLTSLQNQMTWASGDIRPESKWHTTVLSIRSDGWWKIMSADGYCTVASTNPERIFATNHQP